MHATLRLLLSAKPPQLPLPPHALTITLFTRPNCSLCTTAKSVLAQVWERKHFEFNEVDIMDKRNVRRRMEYEFDVPVVHIQPTHSVKQIQAERIGRNLQDIVEERDVEEEEEEALGQGGIGKIKKLMHRISVEEVLEGMGEVEKEGKGKGKGEGEGTI